MAFAVNEYYYPSTSGLNDIYAKSIEPADRTAVKAVFQISHGMAEHTGRYQAFAEFLASHGYAVFFNDHLGHGKSVKNADGLGYFGEEDGRECLVRDVKTLTEIAKKEFPDKPIVLFGHSMGSFIARRYCALYGTQITAAVFCGTSGYNPGAGIGASVAGMVCKEKGSRYRSSFIDSLAFGSYNKKFKPNRTKYDWLTRDNDVVDAYMADDLCGFLFTAAGYRELFRLLKSVSVKAWYASIPYVLPVLLVSGEDDPVGDYGKGVKEVFRNLRKTGHNDVSLKLYPAGRHELLQELNKEEVYQDILEWVDSKLPVREKVTVKGE